MRRWISVMHLFQAATLKQGTACGMISASASRKAYNNRAHRYNHDCVVEEFNLTPYIMYLYMGRIGRTDDVDTSLHYLFNIH